MTVIDETQAVAAGDLETPQEPEKKSVRVSSNATTTSADWSRNRRSSIVRIMKGYKEEERVDLGENIYSLLIVSPTFSWPFLFCMGVFAIKITILAILLSDVRFNDLLEEEVKVTIVKFVLIPVAVAMQEDMMYSFYFYANVIYDPAILQHSEVATNSRFIFSYFLRTIDGILSLFCNYFIMLITEKTLDVFLNFAALQFLYAIDDIFYELVCQGFFGDALEAEAAITREIKMKRRFGKDDNAKILGFIRVSWLDSILFVASLLVCYIIFAIVTASKYIEGFNAITGTAAPTTSAMPSFAPSSMPSDFPSNAPFFLLLSNNTDDTI